MAINIYQEKLIVQKAIVSYFGDLIMTKVKQIPHTPTSPSYSIYYANIGCMLCVEDRYLVVIMESDPFPIGNPEYLSQMNWISFQTRTIENAPYQLKIQQQTKPVVTQTLLDKIQLTETKEDRSVYIASTIPVKVELLYTKEDDSYAEKGTIKSALDTYNCVITFTI